MAARLFVLGIASSFFVLAAGCASSPEPPPRPAVLSHLDLSQKKAFIDKTRTTLKIFHATARDLNARADHGSRSEFAAQVDRFVDLQVEPITGDFEASQNLETRIEIAGLEVLCGMIYTELGAFQRARSLLKHLERRYEDHPEVGNAALNVHEFGFRSIDEGVRRLRHRLYWLGENLPRLHLL